MSAFPDGGGGGFQLGRPAGQEIDESVHAHNGRNGSYAPVPLAKPQKKEGGETGDDRSRSVSSKLLAAGRFLLGLPRRFIVVLRGTGPKR